jgi:hypothetical protein
MLEILRNAATNFFSFHSIEIIHSIVLKWLREYHQPLKTDDAPRLEAGLCFRQRVVLSIYDSSHELGGHERCEDLELIAQNWRIVAPA